MDSHRKLIQDYHNLLTEVSEAIKVQYIMEDFYIKDLSEQDEKIQISYYIRAAVLFFVALLQVCIFMKLIDKKLVQIRNIVIGPQ